METTQSRLERILKATFELTSKQVSLLITLINREKGLCCINVLEAELNMKRSSVQKYIKVLLQKKLISRDPKTLLEYQQMCQDQNIEKDYKTSGGYIYIYKVDKNALMERVNEKYDNWKKEIEDLLS